MREWHAIGVFCEDIREEKSDLFSLIGIMQDNIKVNGIPGAIPKLGIYTRLHISPTLDVDEIKIKIRFADGQELEISTMDSTLIKKTQNDAINQKSPWAGLMNRAIAAPFFVQVPGRILLIVRLAEEELICGTLNIIADFTAANVSSQPAAQSPSSA